MDTNYWNLITKYVSGNASLEEKETLAAWKKLHPDNEKLYIDTKTAWELSEENENLFQPNIDTAWKKLQKKIAVAEQKKETKILPFLPVRNKHFSSPYFRVGTAAAIALLIGFSYFILHYRTQNTYLPTDNKIVVEEIQIGDTTITTQDKLNVFYLPDNSLIWMNKNSHLTYAETFNANERTIHFEGEGFFEIKQDTLPFIIYTQNMKIKVMGTSFNLKAYTDSNEEISVVKGKVEISLLDESNKENLLLTLKETGVFDKTNYFLSKRKTDYKKAMVWKNDKKQFKQTDLYKNEIINPIDHLINNSEWKKNFLKRTTIEGEIHNTAVIANFKDIRLQITYFSKNGKRIATNYFTIKKTIKAYSFINYNHKLDDWYKNTTNVKIEIVDADVAE